MCFVEVSKTIAGVISYQDRAVTWSYPLCPWWRHQMKTFSASLAICAGNSPVPGEFHAQRPVTPRSFDVFFDLRPNKRLSKQWWGWWFETLSSPLWRHCNARRSEETMITYSRHGLRTTQHPTPDLLHYKEICVHGIISKPVTVTSHYSDVIMTAMAPQPASRLFTQPFIQTHIKENIKFPRHWPLCGEFTGTGEFPAQKAR